MKKTFSEKNTHTLYRSSTPFVFVVDVARWWASAVGASSCWTVKDHGLGPSWSSTDGFLCFVPALSWKKNEDKVTRDILWLNLFCLRRFSFFSLAAVR